MIKDVFYLIKKYIKIVLAIIIFIALCIPFILAFLYLKQKGKSIQIKPAFKIIDSNKEDVTDIINAVNEAKEIIKNIK